MRAIRTVRFIMVAALLSAVYTGCKKENAESTVVVKDTYSGKPYRTFVTFQRYNLEQSGESDISNVRIEIDLPDGRRIGLPENGQFWPIGNAQTQEINRSFEIPWAGIKNDGFRMKVQMVRRGKEFLPCNIDVVQLSQFNRVYVCHTDVQAQISQDHLTDATVDKEGVQIRVFTDMNSPSKEIPSDLARSR